MQDLLVKENGLLKVLSYWNLNVTSLKGTMPVETDLKYYHIGI